MTRCFVSELSRIRKGREAISVLLSMVKKVTGRPVANKQIAFLPLAFLV